jgi:hypothetical protein
MLLEHYPLSTYEAVEPGDHFGDSALDFNLYDNFNFPGIVDDNIASISENYI